MTGQEASQPYFKKTENEHLNPELLPQRSTAGLGLGLGPGSQQAVLPLVLTGLESYFSAALSKDHASQQFPSYYVLISLTLL